MKMLMIVCPENRRTEVRALIVRHEIRSYSEIANVLGEGKTGKHLGTHTFPGKSVLIFTIVAPTKMKELVTALRTYQKDLYQGEGFRVFAVPVESIL